MYKIPVSILLIVALLNLLIGCSGDRKDPVAVGNDMQGVRDDAISFPGSEPMGAINSEYLFQKQILGGELRILSYSRNTVQNLISIELQFANDLGMVLDRWIELSPSVSPDLERGLCSKLLDDNGNLIWLTEIAFDTAAPLRLKYTEATPLDTMEIGIAARGDTISQSYVVGGEEIAISYLPAELESLQMLIQVPSQIYARSTPSLQERAADLYDKALLLHNRLLTEVPNLYDNSEGELLLSVVSDPDFIEWLGEQVNPGMEPSSVSMEELCDLVAGLTLFKCIVIAPGPQNPICTILLGLSVACALYKLVCWIFS